MRAGSCTFASGVRVAIILHAGARVSQQGGGICPSEGALLMNIPARRADGDSVCCSVDGWLGRCRVSYIIIIIIGGAAVAL